ncbi:glycosyltransferase [Devosia sp. CAU 1758]
MIGLLENATPEQFGFESVHVWSYGALLNKLPDRPWLVRHNPAALEQSIFHQLHWQRATFSRELANQKCSIVLNTDAGTVSRFSPSVTMSRDMLSYEPGEIDRFGWGRAGLRLLLLRHMQNSSLRRASGAIFLTAYAADVIQKSCGKLANVRQIPHGVGEAFRLRADQRKPWPSNGEAIECVYVSNSAPYKHQWVVVRAVESLRRDGFNVNLTLIGGGRGAAQEKLDAQIRQSDPKSEYVKAVDFVAHSDLPERLSQADLFIFASSCENMPNTLLEGMAAGLPIASSSRGPMPEVLENGGTYFDPEDDGSIHRAVAALIVDSELRDRVRTRAQRLSENYSWRRCADETLAFLAETMKCYQR